MVFYGSLFTLLFVSPSLASSLYGGYSTVLTPYLIGAAVTYAATLECWCLMDCISRLSRYRCCGVTDAMYVRLFCAALSLLTAMLILLVHVTTRQTPSTAALYATGFLLGVSGQLFSPPECLYLNRPAQASSTAEQLVALTLQDSHVVPTHCTSPLRVDA